MTTKVTKESLAERVQHLESGPRSLQGDYNLEAYRMLLQFLGCQCEHKFTTIDYGHSHSTLQCQKCGKIEHGRGNY